MLVAVQQPLDYRILCERGERRRSCGAERAARGQGHTACQRDNMTRHPVPLEAEPGYVHTVLLQSAKASSSSPDTMQIFLKASSWLWWCCAISFSFEDVVWFESRLITSCDRQAAQRGGIRTVGYARSTERSQELGA